MVSLKINGLDRDGRGCGQLEDRRVLVAGALPGETVRVTIEHQSPHRKVSWAKLVALESPASPERVAADCPGHGNCGGCSLQHLSAAGQLLFKQERIERAMAEHPALDGVNVGPVVASPEQWAYRSNVKYVLVPGKQRAVAYASFAPASHRPIDMAGCLVPEQGLDDLAQATVERLSQESFTVYDEATQSGELRYLVARKSADGLFLLIVVTRTDQPRTQLRDVARALAGALPNLVGVVHNVNAKTSGSIFGDQEVVLQGTGILDDRMGDVMLSVSARSFAQGNRAQAANLYRGVVAAAGHAKLIVDLYCGVGPIALALAQTGARVVGVEQNPAAIDDANRSAQALGLAAAVSFVVADAAVGLSEAQGLLANIDLVVVNPPRKGLSAKARAAILDVGPAKIIYVSCEPESLAADLAVFVAAGYRVGSLGPFDMLPGTPHVETLAVLTRPTSHVPRAHA